MISLRIVYVDHYLSKPILNLDPIKSPLNDEAIYSVPILRLFGTTSTGEKCCVHMHGFFPYLTIERNAFSDYSIEQLANELNKQLNDIYPTKQLDNNVPKSYNKIYNVEIIESKNFYGYKDTTEQFIRFQFLNPRSVKLAFRLIKQGKLFNRKCNVFEAHITYIMQFFVNFKLSGMNYIHMDNYHQRKGCDRRLMSKDRLYFLKVEKQSICKLEIDIVSDNIILMKNDNRFINPGLVLVWEEEKRRLIESNKEMKGIFKSNLKDCGNRRYEKKSLELNYLQQLKDYLIYKDNYRLFHQQFNDGQSPSPPINLAVNSASTVCRQDIENLNQSLSQSVLERIIQSEKQLIDYDQQQQHVSKSQRHELNATTSKLYQKDIESQEFRYLIKNLKKNLNNSKDDLNEALKIIEQETKNKINDDSDDAANDCSTDDELDLEKETRFTQLMLKNKRSILKNSNRNDELNSRFMIDGENQLFSYNNSKEMFRLDDESTKSVNKLAAADQNEFKDEEKLSQQPIHSDSSSQNLDESKFNLNNESVIGSPNQDQKSSFSLDSNNSNSSQQLKRACPFDDPVEIGHLVSMNEEPLFDDDDDDDDTLTNVSSQKSPFSPSSQEELKSISQKKFVSSTQLSCDNLSPSSQQNNNDSPTDKKSIFSFYSLDSVDIQCDTPSPFQQHNTPNIILKQQQAILDDNDDDNDDDQLVDEKKKMNLPSSSQQIKQTSTPLHFINQDNNDQIDRHRIRTSLGNKFMKLSSNKDCSSPTTTTTTSRTQSPLLANIQIQSPNHSLNSSNKSTQQSRNYELSFSMNDKIQHLSSNSIDYSSPMSRLTHENQNLTLLTMELFATTDHELKPNPLNDSIKMIFYSIYNDYTNELMQQNRSRKKHFTGIIIQEANIEAYNMDFNQTNSSTITNSSSLNQTNYNRRKPRAIQNLLYFKNVDDDVKVDYVCNELSLVEKFIEVLVEHDPDIITGYEIETSSWGYLISRAELLRIDISLAFSRLIIDTNNQTTSTKQQQPSSQTNLKETILNKTQCQEEDDEPLDLSDREEEDGEQDDEIRNDLNNPILNNNYLNRNKWESLEKYKKSRPDFGTIKTRQDLRNKVQGNDDLVRQYQTIFSLSWVSPCYMSLIGRIMLNLWRCVRKSELALNSYKFENVYYHLFKKRQPYFSPKQLTDWYYSNNNFLRQNVLLYFLNRVKGNIQIIDRLGIVNATSELARVFGIQFSDVISKGSQFRVESLLYRSTIEDQNQFLDDGGESAIGNFNSSNNSTPDLIQFKSKTKQFNKSIQSDMNLSRKINRSLNKSDDKLTSPTVAATKTTTSTTTTTQSSSGSQTKRQKFMLLSCNFEDRLTQQDPVIIPFIMEPKSAFYTSNVAVLDFQSLYPSIMMAYNYCYSTCLGKLDYITNNLIEFPLGFAKLRVSIDFIKENLDNINISPNGILFVNEKVRKGILSSILEEIIETRLMVKKCVKMYNEENEERIAKLLDARQTGLKLLANVTYGYTAAGFSGRMPCIDLADSIISKGRETLINSINFINNSPEFGGQVIYGDTDSMFVEFKNTTREEAFRRAEKLCELITLANPNPIKLKLEKVYSECVLLTKKHYAGYAYDSPEQKTPRFETKGIETIRRDTIGLVKQVMERSLKILFEKKSINEVRPYLERVFYKVINENGENLHQYTYAKEYRGVLGYRPRTYIPSMEISNRIVQLYGEHCRPFIKERVPYIIGHNQFDDRLVKMVYHPLEFLDNSTLRINSAYYIDRVLIPPIQRVFGLLNFNIRQLYADLPKKVFYLNENEKQNLHHQQQHAATTSTVLLTNYFNFVKCLVCDRKIEQSKLKKSICTDCLANTQLSAISLLEDLRLSEIRLIRSTNQCLNCTQMNCIQTQCKSIDCDNLFLQNRLHNDHKSMKSNYEATLNELKIKCLDQF